MHPPLTDLIYQPSENSKVECIPFSHDNSENPAARQQNFTNLSLHTIGQQLNRVENQVSKIASQPTGVYILPRKEKAESSGTKLEERVLFKPMDSKSVNIKLDKKEEILEELTKRLAKLGLKEDPKKKSIVPLTMESGNETEREERQNEEEELTQLESMLRETEPAEVNRIKYPKAQATMDLKPYYPGPSPINL